MSLESVQLAYKEYMYINNIESRNMRTVVHIGQHKTGTTSTQHYLKNNRVELAKNGLYVPDSLVGYDNPSHFILNVYSLAENRYSPMKEKLLAINDSEYFMTLKPNLENDIAQHYQRAKNEGCKDIIWSNEGLYLLNSVGEYKKLHELFYKYSSEIVCICCFRDIASYRMSYMEQLNKNEINFSRDKDSYRYVETDSWLFDYERKKEILRQVFEKVIYFSYSKEDIIKIFMEKIGYSVTGTDSIRVNVTKK
ncbi:MAG: hypothetical protein ACYDGO_07845 [Smithellaceae bacterium]